MHAEAKSNMLRASALFGSFQKCGDGLFAVSRRPALLPACMAAQTVPTTPHLCYAHKLMTSCTAPHTGGSEGAGLGAASEQARPAVRRSAGHLCVRHA